MIMHKLYLEHQFIGRLLKNRRIVDLFKILPHLSLEDQNSITFLSQACIFLPVNLVTALLKVTKIMLININTDPVSNKLWFTGRQDSNGLTNTGHIAQVPLLLEFPFFWQLLVRQEG